MKNKVCGGCYRFKENSDRPQRYNCSCHHREDEDVFAEAEACEIYWDKAEYEEECKKREEEQEAKRLKAWEENKDKPPVKIGWGTSYDHRTDSCVPIIECPTCGEMPYSTEQCHWCGTRFIQNDEQLQTWLEANSGSKEEITDCYCGGKNTKHIMYHKAQGEWRVSNGWCDKCGMRFIV